MARRARQFLVPVMLAAASSSCAGEEGDQSLYTRPKWVACSSTIVVGKIVEVRKHAEDDEGSVSIPPFAPAEKPPRISVVIDVQEWIKPADGPPRAELDIVDPEPVTGEPLTLGGRALFVVPIDTTQEAGILEGRSISPERELLREALPKSETLDCPVS